MKKIICTLLISLFMSFQAFAGDVIYSKLVEDLPLMQGMDEQTEDAVIFDNPSGKIVQFTAFTKSSKEEVLGFYNQTLPPLGWTSKEEGVYDREKQNIKIEVEKSGNQYIVLFTAVSK